jgi:hypothetical protein
MAYDRDRFDRDRYERDRYGRDERGMVERAGDEVRSWFGDEDARLRRERDEREDDRWRREEQWRTGGRGWETERNYGGERPYPGRDYRSGEGSRSEGYRDYGDRYGRSYSAPVDRDRYTSSSERPFGSATSGADWSRRSREAAEADWSRRSRGAAKADWEPGPAFQPYARGSQEFGPEGYGSPTYGSSRTVREWRSSERWRVPGPHVGRGPKGYQRSEERIREEINDRLTAHGLVDATDIEVRIQNGEVTLSGFVDSREAKRAAEDCAEDVQGVREVHNHLRIRSHADDAGVGRTSVLGLTEHDTQNRETARTLEAREQARDRQGDQAARSRPRNQ